VAKTKGCQIAEGNILLFVDAHVVPSRDAIRRMFDYYRNHSEELNGTLHLPVTYHILEERRLIYKLVDEREKGWVHYSFTGYRDAERPYEVPCMSCCGVMMTREIYDKLLGWPDAFNAYGGGENYLNFCLAVLGKKKWIFPGVSLHHMGQKRGYHWTYDGHLINKGIAAYCYGGKRWLRLFFKHAKGRPNVLAAMEKYILESCLTYRVNIEKQQVMEIEEWLNKWKEKQ